MIIELRRVLTQNEGREVQVEIELREGEKRDARSFLLPAAIFEKLGISEGEITREDVMEIMDAEERYRALKRAFDILAYGRNSTKTLADKLRHRGFKPEICQDIAGYMRDNGYIDESEDVEREIELCLRKNWGGRRILMHLHEKGYNSDAMQIAKERLAEIDFTDVCVKCIREKFRTLPKDEGERKKIISVLIRYGFSMTDIKEAAKIVEYYRLPGDL